MAPSRTSSTILRSFSLPIDPHDRVTRRHLDETVIPFSKTPFKDRTGDEEDESDAEQEAAAGEDDDEVQGDEEEEIKAEAVPQWLELFFDLAWTVTFSGLTDNTPIKGPATILSYATFFVLAWWLWVSQVLYDTKFYTNDWFHRLMLALQFMAFVALSSFTDGFDVFNGITTDLDTHQVTEQAAQQYIKRSFSGIAFIFGVTRFLLAIQYMRVAALIKHRVGGNIFMIISSLIFSGLLFFITFFILLAIPNGPGGRAGHIFQFLLWATAILSEIGVFLYASDPRGILRHGAMSERLATLTTVVLGEGLNGLIDPLVAVAKSVGFGFAGALQIVCMASLVLFVFMLYFGSFDYRSAVTRWHQKLIILVHFPLQLSIILLLEGMKSVMGFLNLKQSLQFFIQANTAKPGETVDNAKIVKTFALLGIDFSATLVSGGPKPTSCNATVDPSSNDEDQTAIQRLRLYANGISKIYANFGALDADTQDKFNSYMSGDTSDVRDDLQQIVDSNGAVVLPKNIEVLVQAADKATVSPVNWIAVVAAAFLASLILLILFRDGKRHRYFAWSILTRSVIAIALGLLFLLDFSPQKLEDLVDRGAFLPAVLSFYILQYVTDYVVHWFAYRNLAAVRRVSIRPMSTGRKGQ